MAGTYPDAPSNKIPLDIQGAIMLNISAGPSQLDSSVIRSLTGDSGNQVIDEVYGATYAIVFPYKIDVTHWFIGIYSSAGGPSLSYSTDTTNGVDGVWTALAVPYVFGSKSQSRTDIQSFPVSGVKAVQFALGYGIGSQQLRAFHIYGTPSSGQNPDRLEIWNPSLDQKVTGAHFDWGDVPRGSSSDRTFRVKNMSDTLTANGVVLSFDTISDSSPSFGGSHTLSLDGSIFTSSVTIPSLLPGQISSIVTIRKSTPSNAQVSLWSSRLKAQATSWS